MRFATCRIIRNNKNIAIISEFTVLGIKGETKNQWQWLRQHHFYLYTWLLLIVIQKSLSENEWKAITILKEEYGIYIYQKDPIQILLSLITNNLTPCKLLFRIYLDQEASRGNKKENWFNFTLLFSWNKWTQCSSLGYEHL